ncbi:hypothetical protein FRB95_010719 [Tulasnella sp. JGI-2019a]|nr:hypothetical protein FRB95_010719 [Tulasnella sp. JGI-2019a]
MASHAGVEEEGEEDRFFQVHCILSASLKSIGTGLEGEELTSWYYKIRWFGYTDEDDTSEPEAHLECPELLADFWKYVSGRKLKSGKYSTEYTASPAWIRKQLEHLTEAGKQKDEKLEIKPKSQKPEKHKKSNEPPRKKTSSDTKGKSVDKSSPDFTTIDSDSSKSPTDLFGVELSSSDSVRRKRGRVIVDESSDDGDDDVPLATLAARSQKPCKASSSASGSAGSHAHTSQTSVRASASVHPATGSHTSPVPAMTQSPGKAHNPEPTAMPSDKMKVIPSKSNRKASDDARKGALGSAARAGPAKAIAGNPSASRRKIASSSTLTTATESRDAGRRPPALSSSSAGPSKSSVSTSPQKSSTRKLSFTKNSKLNPSALLQTSPAIITDKHRGARIMMVDGLPALPPERPRANKPSYSKLVKKLPKANTATAGNFMLSLPPKWPRRFSRLTAEKPPADATPNNTQAPSQSDAADNALSGCDDASPKMTCGSTGVQREAPEHCPGLLTEEPPSMFNIELVNGSSAETIPVNCGGAVNTDGDYASVL